MWAACLAQLLVVLDTSIVNVALPTIQRRLDLSASEVSWVALAYALGFAGVLLVGARLGDRLGPARALMWGMVAFAVASLVGGIADSGVLLILARAAQGVCAAVVSPATLTLLTTTYPEGARRVRALAIWTAVSLTGGGIGNILGGMLTQWVSWRGVFLIAVPVAAMVVIGVRPLCGAEPARQKVRVPLTGALLVTAAFALVTYVLSSAAEHFDDAGWVAVAACSAALAGTAIWQQWRSDDPLIPRALWRIRAIVTGNAAILVTGMCFQVSVWFFLTFLMQQHLGYDAFTTGLAFLPLTVVMLVINTWVTPRLLRRA
ncbi:MFS transporter, partial [Salmonella enterica subsp. enterica serovar Kentucky]|nr:MFS transporter [Salmonella enterica subsp. enterica serovar Kentucky]